MIVLRLVWLLLLWILIARLLRSISRSGDRVSLRRLLWIAGCCLLTRIGVQTVAASVLAIALRRGVMAGGVPSIKEAARHFTHALTKLGQKLQRAFILRRGLLLWIAVARRLLLVALGCLLAVLLRITTLLLRIIPLLSLRHVRGSKDGSETPTQSN